MPKRLELPIGNVIPAGKSYQTAEQYREPA